ncbi:MAG: acyl-CoA dehydrogenase family protein [Deltaproteobacteria bacterium]|nr:acyl-CoA dehydrogenase family protein [Deltaproteobacteria bacterium]
MKFDLSEDQSLLRQSTRDFLAGEWPIEKARKVMEESGHDPGAWSRLAEMGYIGLTLPEAVGGQGLGAIELAIVLEEFGRSCVPGPYLDVVAAASLLSAAGKQDALLKDICAGRKLVTTARADAVFPGDNAGSMQVAGGRIQGTKFFVPFAAQVDALVATAANGLHLVQGPFESTPMPTFDLTQRFGKVELNHAVTALGPTNLLERADQLASVGAAAMLLGIMSRCMDLTLEYVQTRRAFNRPIGSFQALQHRLADMLLKTESSRSAVYRAAWCYDAKESDAGLAAASAKAYAGDASRLVCGEAIQMHGGIGFTWELDVHFYFKRAKSLEQNYGSTEEQLERALVASRV